SEASARDSDELADSRQSSPGTPNNPNNLTFVRQCSLTLAQRGN
ncbi:hypothetical protein A2U01_0119431, partial [Trifolium medium]|nr:hypothetical protein [Trifolium medium]